METLFEMPAPTKYEPLAALFKVVALREQPLPADMLLCDTPEKARDYFRQFVETDTAFNPEVECLVVILMNTRRRIKGHVIVSTGIADTILVAPREVFRAAIIASAAAIVIMHNHPSGEASPSEADIKVTRDLIKAGMLLKIDVLDHVIVGRGQHASLKELGYFYS